MVGGGDRTASVDDIRAYLEEVTDPEIPVLTIREMGILRAVEVHPDRTVVSITPTYSGCPAMKAIEEDVLACLRRHNVPNPEVRMVFAPAWTTDWMNAEAKEKLRKFGIAPPGPAGSSPLVQLPRQRTAVPCPYCASHNTRLQSEFSSTACKALYFCDGCIQPFEQFKAI